MQQGLKSKAESAVPYGPNVEPRLSGDRVEQLLAQPPSEPEHDAHPDTSPMHGIWLGAAVGIALWIAVAAIVVRLV